MFNVISDEIPKDEIEKIIRSIRICFCGHGYFAGKRCPINHDYKPIRIKEFIEIDLFYPFKKKKAVKEKEKPIVAGRRNCEMCGKGSRGRQCCSELCKIRLQSCTYGSGGDTSYISIEEAQVRLDAIIKRRLERNGKT